MVLTVLFVGSCLPVSSPPPVALSSTPTSVPAATQTIVPTSVPTTTSLTHLDVGSTVSSEQDGMTLIYVPAGVFSMGNDSGWEEEKPVHTVELEPFWIDQTEITNAMYARCVQAGACSQPSNTTHFNAANYANHPVVYVSWNDASQFENEQRKLSRNSNGHNF